jgi:CubicO group peptidase (beta-lactamase class C family)
VLVRHLLGHTSGIPGFTEVPDFDQLSRSRATPNEVATTIADRAPAFRAGDEWQYSNTNFVLLGRLIELIADAPYADVLQRELPLYSLARMDS